MTDDLDEISAAYLNRLRAELVDLAPEDRDQIVDQVSEHIATARTALPEQTEVGVRKILERLGTPDEIAAVARVEVQPRKRRGLRPSLISTAVAIVLVVFGLGVAALLGSFSGDGVPSNSSAPANAPRPRFATGVTVPAVLGEADADALQTLDNVALGYSLHFISSPRPVGTVLTQTPPAGAEVKSGSRVTLTISGTQSAETVPDVVGMSEAQAVAALTQAGFAVSVAHDEPNDRSLPGHVVAQAPAAGSRVMMTSKVSLTVSSGPSAGAGT